MLTLALATFLPVDAPTRKDTPRERHPLAPSLPLLTQKEEAKIEQIIDRFIDYDTGKLRGAEGLKALKDFKALGPEAIPCLIDGLNRAANLEHSCPAVIIAGKLASFLGASHDPELLEFARENIGAGVTARRHQGVIKDLKLACMLRKSTLQRRALASGAQAGSGQHTLRSMSMKDLVAAADSERGPRLEAVLIELEQRKGDPGVNALGVAPGRYEDKLRQLGRKLLLRHLSRLDGAALKERLKDDRPTVRAAAARAFGAGGWRFGRELIGCLGDADPEVRQAARQALVQLARGADFGPDPNAGAGAQAEAVRQWESWWTRQSGK